MGRLFPLNESFPMEVVFFKSDTGGTVWVCKLCTTPDGKIDFCKLGSGFELEPGSITLCGVLFPTIHYLSYASWTQIKDILGVAGTEDDPVLVGGRLQIGAPLVVGGMRMGGILVIYEGTSEICKLRAPKCATEVLDALGPNGHICDPDGVQLIGTDTLEAGNYFFNC
ncbi:hypothetical protein M758_10G169200 [Ceratodon purpureus]|nr:hypothetical protein M758_10G169200 [Ceratodon purpureus]